MRRIWTITVLAALAAALGGTAPALAAPPAIEGYVWGNQPANPNYFPATGYEYNSAGGAIQIIRNVVGSYHVKFHGMAGVGGVAHASAYGSNHLCNINTYGPRLKDELVHVLCYDIDGNPVDTRFVANVTNRQPVGAQYGYLWNDNPTPPVGGHIPPADYTYDTAGQPLIVYRDAVGHYRVRVGAFTQDYKGAWANGFLTVTKHGPGAGHCQILDPALQMFPHLLRVICWDDTGTAIDTRFTLTYARKVTMLGKAAAHTSATVERYTGVPVVTGWTNPAGAPAASDGAVGSYLVSFPKAGAPRGHAFASMMGTPPMYCNIHAWWASGTTQYVWLRCYDGGGGAEHPAMQYNVGFLA